MNNAQATCLYYECPVCNLVSAEKPCPVCTPMPDVDRETEEAINPTCREFIYNCHVCGDPLLFQDRLLRRGINPVPSENQERQIRVVCIPCARKRGISYEWIKKRSEPPPPYLSGGGSTLAKMAKLNHVPLYEPGDYRANAAYEALSRNVGRMIKEGFGLREKKHIAIVKNSKSVMGVG